MSTLCKLGHTRTHAHTHPPTHAACMHVNMHALMHPQWANIPLQGLDRRALTVGAISGPHSQPGALLWHHFTSRGFTWSAKSIQGKQTSLH